MKIVLKPGGVFLIVGVLTVLTLLIMMRPRPRTIVPAKPASVSHPAPLGVFTQVANMSAGTLTTRKEALPGSTQPVTVYSMNTLKPVANYWDVATNLVVGERLTKNTPLRLVFWARSKAAGKLAANHEESREPFDKSLSQNIKTTTQWKKFDLPFRAVRDYNANESQVAFHYGFAPGTVEIADVQLVCSPQ